MTTFIKWKLFQQIDSCSKMKKTENKKYITRILQIILMNLNKLQNKGKQTQPNFNLLLIISNYLQSNTGTILILILIKRPEDRLRMFLLLKIPIFFKFTSLSQNLQIISSDTSILFVSWYIYVIDSQYFMIYFGFMRFQ